MSATAIVCGGCGWIAPPLHPTPFRCPNAGGDDVDHLLVRKLEGVAADPFFDAEANPFVRFRSFTHAWHTAIAIGVTDAEFVALVRELDEAVAEVDGGGFRTTPLERHFVLVKNETGNVSGSHKGRHLMGLMIWLLVAERIEPALRGARLAIASCGNAALAAAVVARAARRELEVFVPEDAEGNVVTRLAALGASVTRCPRAPGVAGDPSYLRFREAVAAGALPFTCQGNENGLVIEGGHTLGWELAAQLATAGASVDNLFVQVGGGALASACIAALGEAQEAGVLRRMPRIFTVQTAAAFPLARAFERVLASDLQTAVAHRSQFMWPWESVPHSVAHGILDDETYDWAAVVRGMIATGGRPVVVSEARLLEANAMARRETGIPVDATGSSGLAGWLEARPEGESAVLFTGRDRKG